MARQYVDNAYNRSLGRVGMPHGSCVVSRSTGSSGGSRGSSAGSYGSRSAASTTSGTASPRCYVDNAYNRSVGRVGMAHGTCVVSTTGSGGGTRSSSAGSYGSRSAASTTFGTSPGYYADNRSTGGASNNGPAASNNGSAASKASNGRTGGASNNVSAASTTSTNGQRCHVDNAKNRALGRVGKPIGTHVVSRSGKVTITCGAEAEGTSSTGQGCYADNKYNRKVGRVGKPLGSHVISRSGGSTTSSSNGQRCHVDNPMNRALGRVGKPIGTHVVSRSGKVTITSGSESTGQGYYVDNAYNRRLGRVGKPRGTCVVRKGTKKDDHQELLSENTLQDLISALQVLGLSHPNRPTYQYAVDAMEREMIEEEWQTSGLEPMTDTSCLSDHNPGEIIPYDELEFHDKKPIGRGGFAEVYAGIWHGTPIAFKKLLYQQMSRKLQNSFMKEVGILAKLDHPNTVKMFGAVVESGHVGIVMEYMHRSLQKALHWDEVSFSNPKKKSLVNQMANALEYLHHGWIAHCDIKPDNILLDKYDNAKLSDFGISAIKNATETSQSSVAGAAAPPGQGTPRYSAPEVLRGEILKMSELLMTDIYSLAIVVFELLTEEEPYLSLNRRQLEVHVGRGSVRPTSDDVIFSRPVADLLKRCWDARATARPTAIEFRQTWIKIDVLFS